MLKLKLFLRVLLVILSLPVHVILIFLGCILFLINLLILVGWFLFDKTRIVPFISLKRLKKEIELFKSSKPENKLIVYPPERLLNV